MQALGLFFMAWAITFGILAPFPVDLMNILTGIFAIWLLRIGTSEVRNSRNFRTQMDAHRAEMHRLLGEPLDGSP